MSKQELYRKLRPQFDKAKVRFEEAESEMLAIADSIYRKTGICPTCISWDDYNERCPTCSGGRK